MMHKFSYEHNIKHNRSKLRALHPILIRKNLSTPYISSLQQWGQMEYGSAQ